jgi:hypothetical protein
MPMNGQARRSQRTALDGVRNAIKKPKHGFVAETYWVNLFQA